MGFQKDWTVNPALGGQNDESASLDPVPAYQKSADSGIGDKIGTLYAFQVPTDIEVDPDVWTETAARQPLVLARVAGNSDEIWIERAFLADPAYQHTALDCQTRAEAIDKMALADFWVRKRAEYDTLKDTNTVLTATASARKGQGGVITLQPGTYRVMGTADWTFEGQQAPFTMALMTPDGPVLVNPARLDEADESHANEAKAKGAASKLTAAAIISPFPTLPVIRNYLPGGQWLTDDHVHYLTPDQMGAVFVLKRMPDPIEVAGAKERDPQLFEAGAGTPGVRVGDDIFIQLSHLGIGVEHHEAIHRLSHPAVRAILGFDFNEGVTEYFTRQLLAAAIQKGELSRDDAQYQAQHDGVSELVSQNVVTEQDLADAYFAGQLQPLFTKTAARLGLKFSLQGYAMSLTSRYHHGAQQLLAELAEKAQMTARSGRDRTVEGQKLAGQEPDLCTGCAGTD